LEVPRSACSGLNAMQNDLCFNTAATSLLGHYLLCYLLCCCTGDRWSIVLFRVRSGPHGHAERPMLPQLSSATSALCNRRRLVWRCCDVLVCMPCTLINATMLLLLLLPPFV
jgi:hypothetical protein